MWASDLWVMRGNPACKATQAYQQIPKKTATSPLPVRFLQLPFGTSLRLEHRQSRASRIPLQMTHPFRGGRMPPNTTGAQENPDA